jgi:hypothetical protein
LGRSFLPNHDGSPSPRIEVCLRLNIHLPRLRIRHRHDVKLLTFGLYALVDAVYDFERHRNHPLAQSKSSAWWRRIGVPYLAAVPNAVLLGVINGE